MSKSKQATNKEMKELFEGVLQLNNEKECKSFLRDLCTVSELNSMAERFQVVKLLDKGITYREIAKQTGASTATITRIAHWLHHGEGGYKMVLGRLN